MKDNFPGIEKLFVLLLLAILFAACATPNVKIVKPVWPDPPQKPMIRFVTGLRSKEDLPRHLTGWQKFKQAALGERDIAILLQPSDAAISEDGQRLYVTDWVRGYIIVFDFETNTTRTIGAPGSDKPLTRPMSVALDGDENVYAIDQGLKMVRVFDKNGKVLRDIAPFGTSEPFERPVGIAVDKKRNLVYVSDASNPSSKNHRLYVFNTDGAFVRYIGTRGEKDGQFNIPTFLYVNDQGMLYVCDSLNFRIQIFDPEGNFVAKLGQEGDSPGYFDKIKGVATDSFGNIYVADSGMSGVTIYNSKFQPLLYFGGYSGKPGYFQLPMGIAIDKSNKIYVVDSISARVNVYQLLQTTAEQSFQEIQEPQTDKK